MFENEEVSEFQALGDNSYSCRITYSFRMQGSGVDFVEAVDLILCMRIGNSGNYQIYDQFVTGAREPSVLERP
jgi:hypothetical protein